MELIAKTWKIGFFTSSSARSYWRNLSSQWLANFNHNHSERTQSESFALSTRSVPTAVWGGLFILPKVIISLGDWFRSRYSFDYNFIVKWLNFVCICFAYSYSLAARMPLRRSRLRLILRQWRRIRLRVRHRIGPLYQCHQSKMLQF